MASAHPQFSVIVPVYNESANLPVLFARLKTCLEGISDSYELIFINDGSNDDSLALLRDMAHRNSCVRYVSFSRNFGHQIAVSAGLDLCSGEIVVLIDADLQDPPELIPEMFKTLETGYDVVFAVRRQRKGESFLKRVTAGIFYRLLNRMTDVEIPLDTGDFRIMRRIVVDCLKKMPEQQKYLRGQIAWLGFRQRPFEYDRDPRLHGSSGYTLRKLFGLALDGITSFSNFPLRFATVAGFTVSGIAFLLIVYALYSRFFTETYEPGWASIMVSVMFIGGIQLICLGVIGEYISRIASNTRNRPLYVVHETNIDAAPSTDSREPQI